MVLRLDPLLKSTGLFTSSSQTYEYFRRSSVFNSRLSTIGNPVVGNVKDPRQIRDKAYQNNAIKSLINFLVQAGFNQITLTPQSLKMPSGKDFQSIFKFIHGLLDPGYVYSEATKKFEEEVPFVLKGLRYLFTWKMHDK